MTSPQPNVRSTQEVTADPRKPERQPPAGEDLYTLPLDADRGTFSDLLQQLVEEGRL